MRHSAARARSACSVARGRRLGQRRAPVVELGHRGVGGLQDRAACPAPMRLPSWVSSCVRGGSHDTAARPARPARRSPSTAPGCKDGGHDQPLPGPARPRRRGASPASTSFTDLDLTPTGVEQALSLRSRLDPADFGLVLTSPGGAPDGRPSWPASPTSRSPTTSRSGTTATTRA